MKKRVADIVADYLADNGLNQIFTVTGGGAMHLNDAFGHHQSLNCIYNHHEQEHQQKYGKNQKDGGVDHLFHM